LDKKLAIYRPADINKTRWPVQFVKLFDDFKFDKYPNDDRFCFDFGSKDEILFVELCNKERFRVSRNSVLRKITGKDLANSPFYYLHLKEDRDYIEKYEDIFKNTGIEKDHFACQCDVAYTQTRKLLVDPQKSKPFAIKRWPYRKHIILISRKFKELLEQQSFIGFKIIPCLSDGQIYSQEEQQLEYRSEQLESQAPQFQLQITGKPHHSPKVGKIDIHEKSRCKVCGSVDAFNPDFDLETWPYFEPGDLADLDVQQAETVLSDNHGEFFYFTLPVISYRFLKFMIDYKITGLATYYSEMNIKYEAVWIKDEAQVG